MKKIFLLLILINVFSACKKDEVDNFVRVEAGGFIQSDYDLVLNSKSKGVLILENNAFEPSNQQFQLPEGDVINGSLTIRRFGIRGVGQIKITYKNRIVFISNGAGTTAINPFTIN